MDISKNQRRSTGGYFMDDDESMNTFDFFIYFTKSKNCIIISNRSGRYALE